jgi:hypothetical protein
MISIDAVIESLPTMSEFKRATWSTNAARVLARGPRRNPAYANALRLRDAIAAFEATRPAEDDLITTCGLSWDRMVKDRTTFRGFDGDNLVARVTRIKPGKFVAQVYGAALPQPFTTLSAARAAAAGAVQAGADDAPVALPRAA